MSIFKKLLGLFKFSIFTEHSLNLLKTIKFEIFTEIWFK